MTNRPDDPDPGQVLKLLRTAAAPGPGAAAAKDTLDALGVGAARGLVAALGHDDVRFDARRRLVDLDRVAVPALIEALRGTGAGRPDAVWVLSRIGAAATPALPDLLRLLEDPDQTPAVRRAAASAVGSCGPEARLAIPVLVRVSANGYSDCAGDALGRIGPDATATLERELGRVHPSAAVRRGLVEALVAARSMSRASVRTLAAQLTDPDAGVRLAALTGLNAILNE